MRLAVVTTPPGQPSTVGELTRAWLPHMQRHCDVQEFVARGHEGTGWCGQRLQPADRLRARDFDQILFLLGNEASHAFMIPVLHALGGTVGLHDWPLVELAAASRPALLHGGLRGTWAALREGGIGDARVYHAAARTRPREDFGATWATVVGRAQLTLNRSVVRHGDAFLVDSEGMKSQILMDRNSATPIGVVSGLTRPGSRVEAANDESWPSLARQVAHFLVHFPPPRSRRVSLIRSAIVASQQARDERT